jgi:signal transduction histidine kinase
MSWRVGRTLAWVCWLVTVALAAAGTYLIFTMPASVPSDQRGQGSDFILFILLLEFATLGAFLASRRESNRVGWMACAIGLGISLAGFGKFYSLQAQYGHFPAPAIGVLASNIGWDLGIGVLATFFPLLYPDGRLLSRRWRPVAWTAGIAVGLLLLGDTIPSVSSALAGPAGAIPGIASVSLAAITIAAVVSLVLRYRRGDTVQRLQLKWFVAAAAAIAIAIAIQALMSAVNVDLPPVNLLVVIALMALPASVAVAVLKYRLYEIDVVINRALVYGALAAFITAVYVAIVVGVGALINSRGRPSLLLSILATAIVAVAFQPVRTRVQTLANRLVYGYRATPYEALAQFSHRVAGAYANEDVLPRLARVLAEGTGARATTVWIQRGNEAVAAANWPPDEPAIPRAMADRVAEVRHQGEALGALTVKKRSAEPFTPVEVKLVDDLAAQAGQVLRNVRLTSELQARLDEIQSQALELRASRQRIVAVQDAERRRLERNIHDGAQQHLVALAVKLRLAATLAKRDPVKARRSLKELEAQTADALQTLRDLAQGIYPPALREGGLVEALKPHANVTAEGVGRYDPEVEAGVYFSCLEALQNATKHAGASRVSINLRQADGNLLFDVVDDGKGFDPATTAAGSGLQNMRDRIASAGGSLSVRSQPGRGTVVAGRLPALAAAAFSK